MLIYLRKPESKELLDTQLFEGVVNVVEQIKPYCKVYSLDRGDKIVDRGSTVVVHSPNTTEEPHDALFYIMKGYFAVRMDHPWIKAEKVFLSWRGPTDIFGERHIISANPGSIAPEATSYSEVLTIASNPLRLLIAENPLIYRNICLKLMNKMEAERIRSAVLQIPDADAMKRMSALILYLLKVRGTTGGEINGTFREADLAGYLNRRESAVQQAITALRNSKVISYDRGKLRILNSAKLIETAGLDFEP